jgi:hypothetical protein
MVIKADGEVKATPIFQVLKKVKQRRWKPILKYCIHLLRHKYV